ncbi:MAG: alkene reductase [Bacteroidales bacterium]|nr:alkene reductase [Bacteroidales bacterium]MCF8458018.1 alkene reductase [Bacteroidales bacterium]
MKLFSKFKLGNIELQNRMVMAPMTRSRATNNIPTSLVVEYYKQPSGAGLIITEGTSPSPNGLGYPRIPGIFSQEQIDGWKKVTDVVHQKGGIIFIQLMHTGRVSHPDNMATGTTILAPSAEVLSGEMYTDKSGPQSYPIPKEMTLEEIEYTQNEYAQAAKNAIKAGFDGVELHGANGYLIDQFINTASNKRTDKYGGSGENRCRFAIEVATKVADAIGPERTGIRLSPYGAFNGMETFEGLEETYEYLVRELGKIKLSYIHIVDHSSMGAPAVPESVKSKIQKAFGGIIIASGGFDKVSAEAALNNGKGDLVAFGRPYLANPDLEKRFAKDSDLNQPDFNTLYTPGEKGYIDYPVLA